MKLFKCSNCGQLLYFENGVCVQCGSPLGFLSDQLQLVSLAKLPNGNYTLISPQTGDEYRYCSNNQYDVCNWLIDAVSSSSYCRACELNHTIPDLGKPEYLERWKVIEVAKHRLIYTLLRMKLPVLSKTADPEKGLSFDFMADEKKGDKQTKVLTGHNNGEITINISEADDIKREMARRAMEELYRTVLGHFRHEIGHYYWDCLIADSSYIEGFRKLFGDERIDYSEALAKHYQEGAPANWNQHFISAYASTHPWEDWAETWSHYLHIIDTLETAYSFGLSVQPGIANHSDSLHADIKADPYRLRDFETILNLWLPLTFAMNSLNRSMGLHDPYPFVISPEVKEKLKFIHGVCFSAGQKN